MITIEHGGYGVGPRELGMLLGRGLVEDNQPHIHDAECKVHGFCFIVDEDTGVRKLALLVEDLSESPKDQKTPWWAVAAADTLEQGYDEGSQETAGDLGDVTWSKYGDKVNAIITFGEFAAGMGETE